MTVVKTNERSVGGAAAMMASEAEEGGEEVPSSSMDNNFNQIVLMQEEAQLVVDFVDKHQLVAGEKWSVIMSLLRFVFIVPIFRFLIDAKWWERFLAARARSVTESSMRTNDVGPIDNSAILVKGSAFPLNLSIFVNENCGI
jgi:hypothetical protein